MPDYQNGKIYKIMSDVGPNIYIGSTALPRLCQRYANHCTDYKRWKAGKTKKIGSYSLFDEYGLENCKIELIESYPCKSKDELNAREGHYIKELECINKNIAGRSKKDYYIDNKDYFVERYQKNREAYLTYQANYSKMKSQVIIKCDCGGKYTAISKNIHLKTKRHCNWVNNVVEDLQEEKEDQEEQEKQKDNDDNQTIQLCDIFIDDKSDFCLTADELMYEINMGLEKKENVLDV